MTDFMYEEWVFKSAVDLDMHLQKSRFQGTRIMYVALSH
jgi:hypothetical protein